MANSESGDLFRHVLNLDSARNRDDWLFMLKMNPRGPGATYVRKLHSQLTALLRESGIKPALADERVIEIRDALLRETGIDPELADDLCIEPELSDDRINEIRDALLRESARHTQ